MMEGSQAEGWARAGLCIVFVARSESGMLAGCGRAGAADTGTNSRRWNRKLELHGRAKVGVLHARTRSQWSRVGGVRARVCLRHATGWGAGRGGAGVPRLVGESACGALMREIIEAVEGQSRANEEGCVCDGGGRGVCITPKCMSGACRASG